METYIYTKKFGTPVHHSILNNGTSVFTAPRNIRMVTTQIIFPAGSYHDEAFPGTGHYHEHLALKGPGEEDLHIALAALLPKGIKFNAGTSKFHMEFWISGLAEDFDLIQAALLEVCLEPQYTVEQIDRERDVIQDEGRLKAIRDARASWFHQNAFPNEPGLHRSTIGTRDEINRINKSVLDAYTRRLHQLEHAAFFCVGGVSHDQHVAAVTKRLAQQQPVEPSQRPHSPVLQPTFFNGVWRDAGITGPVLKMFFGAPPATTKNNAFWIALSILTRPYGILYNKLRSQHRLVYDFSVDSDERANFTMIDLPSPKEQFERIESLVWEGIDELTNNQFAQSIFDAVITSRKIFFATREENFTRGTLLNWMQDMWTRREFEDEDPEPLVLATAREQVATIAAAYLRRDAYGVLKMLPES